MSEISRINHPGYAIGMILRAGNNYAWQFLVRKSGARAQALTLNQCVLSFTFS